jgi:hypothetical protein
MSYAFQEREFLVLTYRITGSHHPTQIANSGKNWWTQSAGQVTVHKFTRRVEKTGSLLDEGGKRCWLRQRLCMPGWKNLPENLGEVFPMSLVTRAPHVKKPPRKNSFGHDKWQRPTLLEPEKQKWVRYCQRSQDFRRIRREYLTSHCLRKKTLSICLSLTDCGTAGRHGYFRQYGATCHVTRETMVMIQSFFDDRVIYTLRPPTSPNLTPLDFWLWGYF